MNTNSNKIVHALGGRTRSAVMKSKDKQIQQNEEEISELKDSIKTYELLICDLRKKIIKEENLVKILLKEQEDNSSEFERICKDSVTLKKQLAQKDSVISELENNFKNQNKLYNTLLEENEELECTTNSLFTPLKTKLNEISKENDLLQTKLKDLSERNTCTGSKNEITTQKKGNERKIITKSRNKTIKKNAKFNKVKNIHNQSTKIKKISKKQNRIRQVKGDKIESNEHIIHKDNEIKSKSKQKIKQKLELGKKIRIRVIGDKFVNGLGTKLISKTENKHNICNYSYSNAPLHELIRSAQTVIESEECDVMALVIRDFEECEINKYSKLIDNLCVRAKIKNIKLICTNVPYSANVHYKKVGHTNAILNSLVLLHDNFHLINISHTYKDNISVKEYKNIICYYIDTFIMNNAILINRCNNYPNTRKRYDNESIANHTNENFQHVLTQIVTK